MYWSAESGHCCGSDGLQLEKHSAHFSTSFPTYTRKNLVHVNVGGASIPASSLPLMEMEMNLKITVQIM